MAWFISLEPDYSRSQGIPAFGSFADAMLSALDLADTLGIETPEAAGRKVHVAREDGVLEISITIIPGGLTGDRG